MSSRIEVKVKTKGPQPVAFIAMKGPYRLIEGKVREMFNSMVEKGHVIAGMPVVVFLDLPGEAPEGEQLWEIQWPIDSSALLGTVDEHGMGVKQVGSLRIAYAVHKGPVSKLGPVIRQVREWIEANGYAVAGPLREVFMSNPADTPPDEQVTEVGFVVREDGRRPAAQRH